MPPPPAEEAPALGRDLRRALPGTGAGIRVAVVDSGLNATHSHVAPVSGGVAIAPAGPGKIVQGADWSDRLGHGTAVAGAIRCVAPDVELLAVKIFDRSPRATVDQLVAAIRWAIAAQARLINLSVGTDSAEHADRLEGACQLAIAHGALVVAAGDHLPATLPAAVGVRAGQLGPFDLAPAPAPLDLLAHAHPRPLPGPAQRRNFSGDSFAAARATGFLARLLSAEPALAPAEGVPRLLSLPG